MNDKVAHSEMLDLIKRAQDGDASALSEVRRFIDAKAPEMWDIWGDLAASALHTWIDRIAANDPVMREGLERHIAVMRCDLAGSQPSRLQELLIDRIAVCWLQVYDIEAGCAHAFSTRSSMAVSEHRQRLLNHAQRRYVAAIKALSQVRRLLIPNVRINVADRQLNLSGSEMKLDSARLNG